MRVVATSRSLRQHYAQSLTSNQFIDKAITIGELFSRMVIVPNRTFIDEETRLLLLAKASDFEHFQKLQIERDILSFLHNSEYIFRFFEELSGEGVEIEAIDANDTYAEYEEHIGILQELKERYEQLLEEQALMDRIFIPKNYTVNHAYLEGIGTIELELEGYLTQYELTLLKEASKHIAVYINIYAHDFNHKLQKRFHDMGINLETGYRFRINLSEQKIVSKTPFDKNLHITTYAFSERILQVAFIKKQIADFVLNEKIDPEKIIIVLPDESFASTLAMFDDENNFNFAMGHSLNDELFIKRFDAVMNYFDHPIEQHRHRYMRYAEGFEPAFEIVRLHYSQACSMEMFEKIIETFLVGVSIETESLIRESLFGFKKLKSLLAGASLKVMLQLFVRRVQKSSLDDARGGKITVLGLLETRGASYEGVIVVDFNDEFVPKRSQKDLFLSSSIKEHVGLPTTKDREALQKYFYSRLFENAKKVAIAYVKSETKIPSKFLTELGLAKGEAQNEEAFSRILYEKNSAIGYKEKEIIKAYDFTASKLSATGLKTFLSCKRKFYYQYIEKLKEHEIPLDIPQEKEVGIWLHDLLKEVYKQKDRFEDAARLKQAIEKAFKDHNNRGEMGRYLVRLWLEKLEPFYAQEIRRFKEGYRVYACEKDAAKKIHGILLTGTIDRIDTRDGMLTILDYKSGSISLDKSEKNVEKSTDFQLEFYTHFAQEIAEVESAAYYTLSDGKIVPEIMLEAKMERLDTILQELSESKSFNFEKTDDKQLCRFCAYQYLCNRAR